MSCLRRHRWALITAGWLIGVLPCSTPTRAAFGQETSIDVERARALFREALTLEAAGDYSSALSKLQQVAKFKSTPQVRFNVGVCQEKLGRLVLALGEYRIALYDAEQDPAAKKVVDEARRAILDLEPRIPTITIQRGDGAEGASIILDGKEIGPSMVGKPILADPGAHNIEATADSRSRFHREISVQSGEKVAVVIQFESAPSSSPADSTVVPITPTDRAQPTSTPSRSLNTPAWIALGVGIAGAVTSGVFYARRSSAISDLDDQCGPDKQSCPAAARSTYDDGRRDTLIANIGMAVAATGIVTGIVLFATSGRQKPVPKESAGGVHWALSAPGSWAGASISSSF